VERLLTIKDVAGILNISYRTFRSDWRERLLPYGVNPLNVSKKNASARHQIYRFKPSEIEAALERMRVIQEG